MSTLPPNALKAAILASPALSEWSDCEIYMEYAAKLEARGNTAEAKRQQTHARALYDGWVARFSETIGAMKGMVLRAHCPP